jgi:hypothetical protein
MKKPTKKFKAKQFPLPLPKQAGVNIETRGRKKGDYVTISLWLNNTTIAMLRGLMQSEHLSADEVLSASMVILASHLSGPALAAGIARLKSDAFAAGARRALHHPLKK